eukprot:739450-Rhodomonas_salina.1
MAACTSRNSYKFLYCGSCVSESSVNEEFLPELANPGTAGKVPCPHGCSAARVPGYPGTSG